MTLISINVITIQSTIQIEMKQETNVVHCELLVVLPYSEEVFAMN